MRKASYTFHGAKHKGVSKKDSPIIDQFVIEQATPEYISQFDTGAFNQSGRDVEGEITYEFTASLPLPPRGAQISESPQDYLADLRARFLDGLEVAMNRRFGSISQVFVGVDKRRPESIMESGYAMLPVEVTIEV